jgi:hypothetical protein
LGATAWTQIAYALGVKQWSSMAWCWRAAVVLDSLFLAFMDNPGLLPWFTLFCFLLAWLVFVGEGFFITGDIPVIMEENIFIVASCMYKQFENLVVAVGLNTSLSRNMFTSRSRLLKALTFGAN